MQYDVVVTQHVRYTGAMEREKPEDCIRQVETGDWEADLSDNEVTYDRVQVFEDDQLVADTRPDDCVVCGRYDHAGFVDGEPRCHRHMP